MGLRNRIIALVLLALCPMLLFAEEPRIFYAPSASLYAGYYGTGGLTQAMKDALILPLRTSAQVRLDTSLVGFQIGDVELTAGPSLAWVSKSLVYGRTNPQAFCTMGLELSFLYHLDDQLNLGASYTISILNFIGSPFQFKGACHDIQLTIDYAFKLYPRLEWSVIAPLTLSLRGNVFGLQASVGLRLSYYRIMKAPKWLLEQQKLMQK